MDNEKNTFDKIKEQTEEVAEDFAETVEEASEVIDEIIDKPAEKKIFSPGKIIAISSVIATIASIVIMLVGSYCINVISGAVTAKNIEGTWSYDLGGYYGSVYVMLEDKTITLASSEGMEYFSCDYKFSGKNKLNLLPDEETKEKMNGLIAVNSLEVTYDKKAKTITFNPSIGGLATWTAVEDETEIAALKDAIENYSSNDESDISIEEPDDIEIEEVPSDDDVSEDVEISDDAE